MTDRNWLELIDRVLDRDATVAEARELTSRAAESLDLNQRLAQSAEVFRQLAVAAGIPPPPSLKDDVMQQIRAGVQQSATPIAVEPTPFRRRRTIVLAWAASVVIALVAIYPLVRPRLDEPASGTMVRNEGWREVAQAESPSGSASLLRRGDQLALDVRLPAPGSIQVSWDPASLTSSARGAEGAKVTVSCPDGHCPSLAFMADPKETVELAVALPGGEILTLRPPPPP